RHRSSQRTCRHTRACLDTPQTGGWRQNSRSGSDRRTGPTRCPWPILPALKRCILTPRKPRVSPRLLLFSYRLPYSVTANEQKIEGDDDQEGPVDADDHRRPDDRCEVAAGKAAERHAAAERHHIDAHHAAAHLVRGDELNERGDCRK